ncbi:MAG TPA: hypothetical protein VK472_04590 [Allosphingosinicella sp.]|nr:hypothetical protein [Allosphingosinicella sp.]
MMLFLLILLQATASATPPDIELNIHATARSVKIERKGETKLEVRAGPDAGSESRTEIRPPSGGSTDLKDVTVDIHAEARIADPGQNRSEAETSGPD